MTYKFETFSNNIIDALYLTKSMWTEWLQALDEYWDEVNIHYSGGFVLFPELLFQYYNELALCEANESSYLMWES